MRHLVSVRVPLRSETPVYYRSLSGLGKFDTTLAEKRTFLLDNTDILSYVWHVVGFYYFSFFRTGVSACCETTSDPPAILSLADVRLH